MNSRYIVFALGMLGLSLALGCTKPASTTPTTTGTDSASAPAKVAETDSKASGTTCYFFENETLTLVAILEYDGKAAVKGVLDGVIEDDAEGYYTSYTTEFSGTLEGNSLKVKTTTEIEGDVQEEEATWKWDGLTLDNGRQVMKKAECEADLSGE